MNHSTRAGTIGILAFIVAATGALAASSSPSSSAVDAGSLVETVAPSAVPTSTPATAAAAPPRPSIEVHADFDVSIEPDLRPAVAVVEGLGDGDATRPVGRIAEADGASDLVRDELIVSTRTDAELQAFLERWDGVVLDSFPAADDGVTDHLFTLSEFTHGQNDPKNSGHDS